MLTNDDVVKVTTSVIEAMKEVFPTAEEINTSFQNAKDHTDEQFEKVITRLDNIEHILLAQQERRIEKLEREVQELKNALAT